jgi:hypothetical protein
LNALIALMKGQATGADALAVSCRPGSGLVPRRLLPQAPFGAAALELTLLGATCGDACRGADAIRAGAQP